MRSQQKSEIKPKTSEILEFQTDVVEIEENSVPGRVRWVLYCIILLMVAAVLWATFGDVDRVVMTQGRVVAIDGLIQIQPLKTSVIKKIHVNVGQKVHNGQVLVTLDSTLAATDLQNVTERLLRLRSQYRRLQAELDGSNYAPMMDEIYEAVELQKKIFLERQKEYAAQIAALKSQLDKSRAYLAQFATKKHNLTKRHGIYGEIEKIYSQLQTKGLLSATVLLETQDKIFKIEGELNEFHDEANRVTYEINEIEESIVKYRANWNSRLAIELNDVRNRYTSTLQEHNRAVQNIEMTSLKSPLDGVVLEIGRFFSGSIARTAESIITLVPTASSVEIEANIDSKDIARIRVGDLVQVKLTAFPYQRHGTLIGKVRVVTDGVFKEDGQAGQAYYRTKIKILNNELKHVPDNYRLIPGMEAIAEIKVGSRRVIDYLIYPIVRAAGESMREP